MVVRQVEEGVPYCLERRPVIAALAVAGIAGPLLFVVDIVRQSLLHPDYSQVKLPISALAAWPGGWVQNVNFVIFGLLMISCKRTSDVVVREAHRSRPFPYRRDDRAPAGGCRHRARTVLHRIGISLRRVVGDGSGCRKGCRIRCRDHRFKDPLSWQRVHLRFIGLCSNLVGDWARRVRDVRPPRAVKGFSGSQLSASRKKIGSPFAL
jgi:Protein of unknown function (DUF998)